jgi:mannose-6-phosphate isomerase-like protein (cupin superfamily)
MDNFAFMSGPSSTSKSVIVPPGEGRVIRAFGAELHFHLSGDQTEGRFVQATIITPPDNGPPPHYHLNEDECFVVMEGRISIFAHGAWTEVAPGSIVFTPKGTVHTYKNTGTTPSRMLFSAAPAGFELFFAECEKEFQKVGGPDQSHLIEISAKYGIYYV